MARRSPIRLVKLYADEASNRRNKPFVDQPVYDWECDEKRLDAAFLIDRHDPTQFAIVHRSTKPDADAYPWQVSFFDEAGPVSDSRAKSCTLALRNHLPRHTFRLRKVEAK